MRRLLFAALFAISLSTLAQSPIAVYVVPVEMSSDTQLTFLVDIPQTSMKDVEKDWLKYVGTGSKGKAVVVDGIYHQTGAYNGNMSAHSFFVHSKLLETSEGVRLSAWFTQDDSPFISEDTTSDQHLAAQKYLRDFAVQEYRQAVQQELEAEQDILNEMEKQLTVLNSDEDESIKTISENKRSTGRANEAIVTNNSDIQTSSEKIYDQKEMVVRTASDPKATKGAKKTLDNLEKEKRDLEKKNETQGRNNDGRAKENRKEERSITDTNQSQVLKTEDIEVQKLKVHEVKTKLENIQ